MAAVGPAAARVERCLRAAFGGAVEQDGDRPAYLVRLANPVWVRISPVGDGHVVVDVATWPALRPDLSPELVWGLLTRNARIRFGKLGLDRDGDVVVEHSLLAETVECDGLKRVVELVAAVAADLERELA